MYGEGLNIYRQCTTNQFVAKYVSYVIGVTEISCTLKNFIGRHIISRTPPILKKLSIQCQLNKIKKWLTIKLG